MVIRLPYKIYIFFPHQIGNTQCYRLKSPTSYNPYPKNKMKEGTERDESWNYYLFAFNQQYKEKLCVM